MGIHRDPQALVSTLRAMRRQVDINTEVGVVHDIRLQVRRARMGRRQQRACVSSSSSAAGRVHAVHSRTPTLHSRTPTCTHALSHTHVALTHTLTRSHARYAGAAPVHRLWALLPPAVHRRGPAAAAHQARHCSAGGARGDGVRLAEPGAGGAHRVSAAAVFGGGCRVVCSMCECVRFVGQGTSALVLHPEP